MKENLKGQAKMMNLAATNVEYNFKSNKIKLVQCPKTYQVNIVTNFSLHYNRIRKKILKRQ